MEAAILISLISGAVALVSAGLQFAGNADRTRSDSQASEREDDLASQRRVDERFDKLLARQDLEMERAREELKRALEDLAEVKGKCASLVDEVAELRHAKTRDQQQILDLQSQVQQLQGSTS